ncbi:hypothetical protein [Naasia lichenicola]|uniref:DUF2029 domain-containing protein n=1 Tax=Naasia lichenicola TaxID=2565933 RepID=A0A4S4FRG3_9MICO|nr:hypothetical protein [Naasia lichenicola]THG33229.1 hypothetical protein E6C64_02420 [Naasia lichenicola]
MTDLRVALSGYRMPPRLRIVLTVLLAFIAVAGLAATSFVAASGTSPGPADYDLFGAAGADILTGNWGEVFVDPALQAGPWQLLFWGIPAVLGVQGAAGWTSFYLIAGALIAGAVALLAHRITRPIIPSAAPLIAIAAAALASASGVISASIAAGHPAQSVIPLLWMSAALSARRGSAFWAAALIGVATGWEIWGILGVPVLLLLPRIGPRAVGRAALGGLAALAVAYGPFLLAGPVTMFGFAWPIYDGSLLHLLLPDGASFSWPLRAAQGLLTVAAGAAVALWTRGSRDAIWLVPLAVCSVRLLTDPVLAGYYFTPVVLAGVLCFALAVARRSLLSVAVALVTINVANGLQSTGWIAAAVLVAITAVGVIVARRADRASRSSDSSSAPAPVVPTEQRVP